MPKIDFGTARRRLAIALCTILLAPAAANAATVSNEDVLGILAGILQTFSTMLAEMPRQQQDAAASVPIGDGAPNTTAAVSNIGQLSGVTITNANLTASEIPSLNYLPATGGTVTGLSTFTNASTSLLSVSGPAYFGTSAISVFGADGSLVLNGALTANGNTTLTNATSTNLAVSGTASTSALVASKSLTLPTSFSGVLHATAGVVSAAAVNLASDVSGILPVGYGGTGWTNVTTGSILFGNGSSALATSSNLYWDNTDGRLGIGSANPAYAVDVIGFINTDQNSGFKQAGNTVLYASSTNSSLAVGASAAAAWMAASSSLFQDIAIGQGALAATPTNSIGQTVAVGPNALNADTSGSEMVAIGHSALASDTTGLNNDAIGWNAGSSVVSGNYNDAFGHDALSQANGPSSSNTCIGEGTCFEGGVKGPLNDTTAIGTVALLNATNDYNTAVGASSLTNAGNVEYNVALGAYSCAGVSTGNANLCIGMNVGRNVLSTGSNNIFIGTGYYTDAQASNSSNTLNIGNLLYGINLSTTANPGGNVGIGTTSPDARLTVWGPDTASTSAFAVVNNASTTEFAVYDTGNAVLSGGLTQNSDQRLKTNVQSLDASSSLAAIDALNPVSFKWINGIFGGGDQLGFIAQAVQTIFPQLISTTSPTALTPNGTLGLNYSGLIAPIVGAIQALSTELSSLENTVAGFADNFTSNQITATNELCIGSTCINQQQLAALLASQNEGSLGQGSGSSGDQTTSPPDTPPVIQINGDNPAIVQVGATYNDLGATITGPTADLNLGLTTYLNGILADPLTIDTSQPATDTISYVAIDQNGLAATSTRTVIVQAATTTAQ